MTTAGPQRIGEAERRRRLGLRHRLVPSRRTDDVVAIAADLVALHSSDPVTVYLSAAARMRQPSLAPIARALYDEHTLIRHHAMRRTLWVMTPEVARLAHACCTTALVPRQRSQTVALLEESGVAADGAAWLDDARRQVLEALHGAGEATARTLGRLVPDLQTKLQVAPGKPYAASVAAHTRVMQLLGFEGSIVRGRPTGTWINSEYHWAPMTTRIPGGIGGIDPDVGAAGLASRWLRSFGPALATDLQWWAGWSGATTTRAFAACGAVEVDLDGATGWMLPGDVEDVREAEPWVALLPGLDPTTMGWRSRDWYLDPANVALLFDRNGNAGPTIWVDGRVVGGWVQRRNGEIATRVLTDVGREREQEIAAAADALRTLLGETRFRVRFSAPLQAELL